MQTNIKIATKDNKVLYGVLEEDDPNTSKLIIFVHGFTGSKSEHHYFNAASFFNPKGIATFRFNLYGRDVDTRKTSEVSFRDHLDDTRRVVDHFAPKYKEIYLVGHSLGACVVALISKKNVKKIVLWDPSNGFASPKKMGIIWNDNLNAYVCYYKMVIVFGKDLIEEWMQITIDKQISSFEVPTKIIFAGGHNKYDQWKDYLDKIKVENDYAIIPGASHTFAEEGKTQELYEETYKWIG